MKTRAAVLRKPGTPWEVTELEVDPPKELAALVSCGVTTGFCSAVYAGDVGVGDTVVVFGTGGVGMNAVQGAALAGAKHVIAIDPNEWKQQQALSFGATHAFGDPVKATDVIIDLTRGQLADTVICTVGEMDKEYTLDEINGGYKDLMDGKNIRGVIVHQH